ENERSLGAQGIGSRDGHVGGGEHLEGEREGGRYAVAGEWAGLSEFGRDGHACGSPGVACTLPPENRTTRTGSVARRRPGDHRQRVVGTPLEQRGRAFDRAIHLTGGVVEEHARCVVRGLEGGHVELALAD